METSFKDKTGIEKFLEALAEITDENYSYLELEVPIDSDIVSTLSRNGELRGMEYKEDTIVIKARIHNSMLGKYQEFEKKNK